MREPSPAERRYAAQLANTLLREAQRAVGKLPPEPVVTAHYQGSGPASPHGGDLDMYVVLGPKDVIRDLCDAVRESLDELYDSAQDLDEWPGTAGSA